MLEKIRPLSVEHSALISEAIKNRVLELSINIHGNHVIQTCLEIFVCDPHKKPIYDTIEKYAIFVSKDKQGCCVM